MSQRDKTKALEHLALSLQQSSEKLPRLERRNFLKKGLGLAGAVAASSLASGTTSASDGKPPNVPAWTKSLGPGVLTKPYGEPSKHEAHVHRRTVDWLTADRIASISFTPLGDLKGIITPGGVVFERYHAGLPQIDPQQHYLMIHGKVKRPIILSMDELMRFPSVSVVRFLECPANGGMEWRGAQMNRVQFTHDMLSCCERTGVLLSTVLEEVGLEKDARWILAEGADGAHMSRSIPIEKALDDAMIVYAQYVIKTVNQRRIAVIGQAFPYTPIANPRRFIPDWTFGIRAQELSELAALIREQEKVGAVVLPSHNGMDVDLKLASEVFSIDFILGGHTHDGVPLPVTVHNPGGKIVVTNAGSNGKYVGVLDIRFGASSISGFQYRLLPVFANLLPADPAMQAYIDEVRAPWLAILNEPLAVTESLLYRRGNFSGTFDQLICDALRDVLDARISLSPGFRWGTSILPGETITMERVLDQTCMSYPETYVREMSGEDIRFVLESVCDNLFNADPYYQQGGDMVRVGGLRFSCAPNAAMGKRIDDLELLDGTPLEASKSYKVAGWATVASQAPGAPVWDVVADYLRAAKTVNISRGNNPVLKGVEGNPGLADYN